MGVELARLSGGEQRLERVGPGDAGLRRAEDRLRLPFDPDVHDGCGRERRDSEGGCESREDGERTAKHESSFREGFGLRGGRQVF